MHFGVVLDNNFQRTYATTLAGDGATAIVIAERQSGNLLDHAVATSAVNPRE